MSYMYHLLPVTEGYITNTILTNIINFLAPVVGIAMVIFCVIQAFKIFKGSEGASVKSLIIGIALLLFILGIMFAAGSFQTYGNIFKGVTDSAVQGVGNNAKEVLG